MSKIITITTAKAPLSIPEIKVKIEAPGVAEIEVEESVFNDFKKIYEKSKFFQKQKKLEILTIHFESLNQSQVDQEFEKIKKYLEETGKHKDLLDLGIKDIKELYIKEVGAEPGKKQQLTLIREIVAKREEIEAAGNGQ